MVKVNCLPARRWDVNGEAVYYLLGTEAFYGRCFLEHLLHSWYRCALWIWGTKILKHIQSSGNRFPEGSHLVFPPDITKYIVFFMNFVTYSFLSLQTLPQNFLHFGCISFDSNNKCKEARSVSTDIVSWDHDPTLQISPQRKVISATTQSSTTESSAAAC